MEKRPLLMLGMFELLCLFVGLGFGVRMLQIYAMQRQIVTNIALASIAFVLIGFFDINSHNPTHNNQNS